MQYDPEIKRRALEHLDRYGPAPTHVRIVKMAGQDRHILDLGCATGYIAKLLQKNGCRVTGIELDPEAAKQAEDYCDRVLVGDAGSPELIKMAGSGFDAVMAADVLEHLVDPWEVLKALHAVLKPDGFVLVSIPNVAYWEMRIKLLRGRFDYESTGLLDWTHLRFFTVNTFHEMAESCGYRITQCVVNDAGFPFSRILSKIPGFRRFTEKFACFLANRMPNLFVFHSIYRLDPVKESRK